VVKKRRRFALFPSAAIRQALFTFLSTQTTSRGLLEHEASLGQPDISVVVDVHQAWACDVVAQRRLAGRDKGAAMETLEFGYELIRARGRLSALADWLSPDHERAGAAVRDTLSVVWRCRGAIDSIEDLERQLNRVLRSRLDPRGPRGF
jgi:hypothetical protein